MKEVPDHPAIYMTDHIINMVEGTYNMLDNEWYRYFQHTYPPVGYRRDMKTIRLLLPRRSGMSTAARRLYQAHPTSLIYFPRRIECDSFIRQFNLERLDDHIRTVPQTLHDLVSMDGRLPHAQLHRDLVIFDGVSRMKREIVEDVCGFHDPFTKLFVLLG